MRRLAPLLVLFACNASNQHSAAVADVAAPAAVATPVPMPSVPEPPSPPPIVLEPVGRHVLIVGDSEACAVSMWIDLKKTVRQINDEERLPYDTVDVTCKGGTVIQYWGAGGHLKQALEKYPNPDAVVVFLGTNHYYQNQQFGPPTHQVTDLLKDTNCIWVGNTAVHGRKWPVNRFIHDSVTQQCQYFDTEAANIPLADGVHPTPAGAIKWIRGVWPLIPRKYEAMP